MKTSWKNRAGSISKELYWYRPRWYSIRWELRNETDDTEAPWCLKPYYDKIDSGDELVIEFTSTGYHDSGVTSGPPERCYPPEGDDEREVDSVYILKSNGERIPLNDVAGEIEAIFLDDIQEEEIDTSPDEPDYDD
jgi:hypothetical protein